MLAPTTRFTPLSSSYTGSFVGNVHQTEDMATVFKLVNNQGETRTPTALFIATTIVAPALIFAIAASLQIPPQPDHASTTLKIMVDEQTELLYTMGQALLILALVTLPLVKFSLPLPQPEVIRNDPGGRN